jgi:hypothetical protein
VSYSVSQLSPQSTRGLNLKIAVHGALSTPEESFGKMQFWRSWLEYESGEDQTLPQSGANWYRILGLVLTVGIGCAFWGGVGLVAVRLLR